MPLCGLIRSLWSRGGDKQSDDIGRKMKDENNRYKKNI